MEASIASTMASAAEEGLEPGGCCEVKARQNKAMMNDDLQRMLGAPFLFVVLVNGVKSQLAQGRYCSESFASVMSSGIWKMDKDC